MAFHLVAMQDVLGHRKGEVITDAAKIDAYMKGDWAHMFNRIQPTALASAPSPLAETPKIED